jgi:hypothetical protein
MAALARPGPRVGQPAGEHRSDGVQRVGERGEDAEVSAAAAQAPEQVRVLLRAGMQHVAVGDHDVDRKQVVAREAADRITETVIDRLARARHGYLLRVLITQRDTTSQAWCAR